MTRIAIWALVSIIALLGIGHHSASAQQTSVQRDLQVKSSRKFNCYFIGKTEKAEIELEIDYTNKNGVETLEIKIIDELSKEDSFTVNEFNAETIRTELNKKLPAKKIEEGEGESTSEAVEYRILTSASFMEIFVWMRGVIYGIDPRPVAGRFIVASYAKLYPPGSVSGYTIMDGTAALKHQSIDSIVARLQSLQSQIADCRDRIKKYNDTLAKYKDKLSKFHSKDDSLVDDIRTKALSVEQKPDSNTLKELKNATKIYLQLEPLELGDLTPKVMANIFDTMDILLRIEELANQGTQTSVNKIKVLARTYGANSSLFNTDASVADKEFWDWVSSSDDDLEGFSIDFIREKRKAYAEILNRRIFDIDLRDDNLAEIASSIKTGVNVGSAKRGVIELNQSLSQELEEIQKLGIVKINRVDLQVERGFLENVKVIADVNGVEQVFENVYAIGFTSKRNFKDLLRVKLFERTSGAYLYLGDIVRIYDNELDLYTRDYSPADTSIKIYPAKQPEIEVYRAPTHRLFDAKLFTEVTTLASDQAEDEDNGGGLVQLEISRKFNLNTFRVQQFQDRNVGLFNYVYLFGSLNKIERQNRDLVLRNDRISVGGTVISPNYVSTLDLLEYRSFILGAELNTFLFDLPSAKTTFTIDLGAQYGQTPILDNGFAQSVSVDDVVPIRRKANMLLFYPKLGLELFSERRVGISLSYQLYYAQVFTNNHFKTVASYAKSNTQTYLMESSARLAHMFEYNVRADLNSSGSNSIFLRSRLFWQQGDMNSFFPQIQFGYSYLLQIPHL